MTSHSLDTILIGLEATSVYVDSLVYFLREDTTLTLLNRKIHVLNPKQVNKFHDYYNDLPTNDFMDSLAIADCLHFGRINKEVIWETTTIKLSKTSHANVSSLFIILSKKNSDS